MISSPSEPQAHALNPRRWLMLVVVLCASFMGTLDEYIINVAVPSIQKELHSSFAEVQLIVAVYALAYAVLLVIGGRLGDLYGRKRLFLLGVGIFTTGMLGLSLYAGQLFLQAFYLQTVLRLSPLQAGLAFLVSSITFILMSSLSSFFSMRLNVWGMSVVAGLMTLAYLVTLLAAQWFVAIVGNGSDARRPLFTLGIGIGLLFTPLMSKTLEEIRVHDIGTASGVFATVSQLSGALGITLLGLIFSVVSASNGSRHAFVIATLVAVVLSLGLWLAVLPLKGSREASRIVPPLVEADVLECSHDWSGRILPASWYFDPGARVTGSERKDGASAQMVKEH